MSAPAPTHDVGKGSPVLRGNLSELGVAALLAVVGIVVAVDAMKLDVPYSQSDPVGPRTMPYLVGALLLTCAVLLAVDVLRGGHGEAEDGEDVDLSSATEWRVVVPLVLAFLANVLLIDVLGWVLSGTLLFFCSAYVLGSRHLVRDLVISVTISVITFYGFYSGLGVLLPAGLLEGVL